MLHDETVVPHGAERFGKLAAAARMNHSNVCNAARLRHHLRRKIRFRAVWAQSAFIFVAVPLLVCAALRLAPKHTESGEQRRLDELTPPNAFTDMQMRHGAMLLHLLCMLYMFIGIAIICDEYFVSALELISERLNISDDVAGATFMAAGGSAPEFATSMLGVFVFTSDVGFGTIVGSAVFNILFVIGLCAYFSGFSSLSLTWYPLLRDASYYLMSLGILVGLVADLEVRWYDAAILFSLYGGYVTIMKFDPRIKRWIVDFEAKHVRISSASVRRIGAKGSMKGKVAPAPETDSDAADLESSTSPNAPASGDGKEDKPLASSNEATLAEASEGKVGELNPAAEDRKTKHQEKLLGSAADGHNDKHTGHGTVRTPGGSVPADGHKNGHDGDGSFSHSFLRAGAMPVKPVEDAIFHRHPHDKTPSRTPSMKAKSPLVAQPEQTGAAAGGGAPANIANGEGGTGSCAVLDLAGAKATAGGEAKEGNDEEEEPATQCPSWPEGTCNRIKHLLLAPLLYSFAATVPDCRVEKFKPFFFVTFVASMVWIALLTYVMVWMAEEICAAINLPSSIAGVTILAAGTSIPDAISSVIVAREGHGDMALSSSIGSNVFDITFGLPVPWLLSTAIVHPGSKIRVQSKSLPLQVGTLMVMVLVVVVSIHMYGWSINKKLGVTYFILYFLFVAEAVLLETDPANLF